MTHLDEVVIHNFKSFRRATIKFDKGFNCIVGPNGSGKSNICDALLFALGETSLKRMRVSSASQLINNYAKPSKEEGFKKASVKVRFSGDKDIEIMRAVNSKKKVAYRLNGKRVTRQEVIEVLRDIKSEINETNTMTQGEINYLLNLNPKGRRELIDVAAGIREFNEKRDASLKELEKVEMNIDGTRLILNERSGFLSELEKEKKDAERYMELKNRITQLTYTILKLREQQIMAQYEESAKDHSAKTGARQKTEKAIAELDSQIMELTREKDKLSKSLNAKSAEAGSTNKMLEEVNKNIAVANTQLGSLNESTKSSKERMETLQGESKKLKAKQKENSESLKKINFEIEVKSKDLPEQYQEAEGTGEVTKMTETFDSNTKKVDQSEDRLLKVSPEYAQLLSEYEGIEKVIVEYHRELNELGARRGQLTETIKVSKETLSTLEGSKKQVEKELEKQISGLTALQKSLETIYQENVETRDSIAKMGGSSADKSHDALKKGLKEGFHGRASDLCDYDDKHAAAINAAAGTRFNYFVVDTADTAGDAIKILKNQKLGRASFIPLDIVNVKESKAPKEKAAQPIIELVRFDKRHSKAFEYIFANTYLVESIKAAQDIGIGSHRFVTVEGDLVEPSGIISGGSVKSSQTLASLENKLKKLDEEKRLTNEKITAAQESLETVRRKLAKYDTDTTIHGMEVKNALAEEDAINRNMESLNAEVKKLEDKKREIKDRTDKLKVEKERLETIISQLKKENTAVRANLDSIIAARSRNQKSKEEISRLKALHDEIESLKINAATFTKENELLVSRLAELDTEIKSAKESLDSAKAKISQLEKETESLNKSKTELQESIEVHGKKTSGIFKDMQALDEKATRLGFDKGKLTSELEKANRDLIALEMTKGQLQTRINDIKAELLAVQKTEVLEGKPEELEKDNIRAKAELDRLGAVNLKAPEMYESKKKDVEQAQTRMSTLESEKASIMSMIGEIETKKLTVFLETLEQVNENFKKLYGYVFDGETNLYLQNQKDPFNSGLLVDVTFNGKKQNADLLSGGQKSLVVLMLIFAIQMRKPMAFYIFDEIDVALDKENSKKLSKLIKELSEKSQFIVVSHNDSLIAAADTAVGVVNKANESQVVGIQLASKQ